MDNDILTIPEPAGLKFVKTHQDAVLPVRNHKCPYTGDSGFDITSVEDKVIPAKGYAVVDVGLKVAQVAEGVWFKIEARSGLGFKHHIFPHFGIIDNGYRGDCGVKLYNFGDKDYEVKKGDKIAQFVLYMLVTTSCAFVDEVIPTERGEKGFGSSGR